MVVRRVNGVDYPCAGRSLRGRAGLAVARKQKTRAWRPERGFAAVL